MNQCLNPEFVSSLGDYRHLLVVGATFNYVGYFANGKLQPGCYLSERWSVERVVERGVVVSHPSNKGHQHLLEWTKPIAKIRFDSL